MAEIEPGQPRARYLARELLGWEPRHTLDEGLELTIEWLGRHLRRYRPGTYQV